MANHPNREIVGRWPFPARYNPDTYEVEFSQATTETVGRWPFRREVWKVRWFPVRLVDGKFIAFLSEASPWEEV